MIHVLRDGSRKYEIFWKHEGPFGYQGARVHDARLLGAPTAEPGAISSSPVPRVPARHGKRAVVHHLEFLTMASALGFLRRFATHPFGGMTFRTLLGKAGSRSAVRRFDDQIVLRAIASHLVSGELLVYVVDSDRLPGSLSVPEIHSAPVLPERRRSPGRSTSPAPPQESTLPSEADPVAIADVLKAAARGGVPLCEECMRDAQTASTTRRLGNPRRRAGRANRAVAPVRRAPAPLPVRRRASPGARGCGPAPRATRTGLSTDSHPDRAGLGKELGSVSLGRRVAPGAAPAPEGVSARA
jgi:hypothetical protein